MEVKPIYKTAEALGIEERTRQGLVQLARDLADGTVPPERFDMSTFCGTACCIGGHLQARGQIDLPATINDLCAHPMRELFCPSFHKIITPLQALRAIVNFLTTGHPRWDEAVRGPAS